MLLFLFCGAQNAQLLCELNEVRSDKERLERDLGAENDVLKTELAKLRAELDAVLQQLEGIIDTKAGLEIEIAAYRALLEGQDTA